MNWLIEPIFYNWLILGAILLVIELSTFTFLFLWLAIASFVLGGLVFIMPSLTIPLQLLLYALLSLVSIVLWFRLFRESKINKADNGSINQRMVRYLNQQVSIIQSLNEYAGKVNLEDSLWRVEADEPIKIGDVVKLIAINNMTFKVEKVI